MALTPRLELRQGQTLVMTPQLQQAIKLLQLSNLELTAYVEQELERNPLLERDEETGQSGTADGESRAGEDNLARQADRDDIQVAAREGLVDGVLSTDTKMSGTELSNDSALDADLSNVFDSDAAPSLAGCAGLDPGDAANAWASMGNKSGSFDDSGHDLENLLAANLSLQDFLTEQLQVAIRAPVDRMIGAYLIDMVDEAGYLRGDLTLAAERLGCPLDMVETVLKTLQTFEPVGVFARSLAECLALQLKERDRFDPAMAALVANLELVARRDHAALMRICAVDSEDLADMLEDLKRCNPKPGLAFGSDLIQPVIPDVFVREGPDGAWLVELNSETLPRVLVNARYYAQVSKSAKGDDKAYLTECMTNANWLVKSLDQRARTILKVASEIVRQQDAFLILGIQHLRPLNLRTIADAIEMHESTVSRVTANKYMATSRGVFELKYFFTSAIASATGGEAHSAEAVRHRIKTLVESETADMVLSDDRIVELLHAAGIDIARRTVAKYREAMRIPSSVQRRRSKRLAS